MTSSDSTTQSTQELNNIISEALNDAYNQGAKTMFDAVIATLREAAPAFTGVDGRVVLEGVADKLEASYFEVRSNLSQDKPGATP